LAFVILLITREKPGVWFKGLPGDLTDKTEEKNEKLLEIEWNSSQKCHYLLILMPFQTQMLLFLGINLLTQSFNLLTDCQICRLGFPRGIFYCSKVSLLILGDLLDTL